MRGLPVRSGRRTASRQRVHPPSDLPDPRWCAACGRHRFSVRSRYRMNFHEYQAKELFAQYGIAVPPGKIASSPDAAVDAAKALGGSQWMVKAQIHAGGRGKAGGVKFCRSLDDVHAAAKGMLGTRMATYQSAGRALPVNLVLVTDATNIAKELYLSVLVDRDSKAVSFIASKHGGVDIEQVAKETPEDIHTIVVDFVEGLQPYQCRQLGFAMDLNAKQVNQLTKIMLGLYKLFNEKDLSLVELNPLAILEDGNLAALDGKVNSDDNADFRHPELVAMRDLTQEDAAEAAAVQNNLNYVTMDGSIGCMVNGAGLAMATMDVIKLAGGEPANFLDVGGGATKERVTEAFKLILSSDKVRCILVNIFGGIVRCDLIAEGIIAAVKEVGLKIPVVVRLQGTNVDQGRELLANSGLAITPADDLNDAAQKAVAAAK
ncbi:ADP-forming succinate--CoA ligase subunit beta [Rhodanobacter denitrificans]|uniref:ADP-forming succinate--CoA ligase subunit beta n=1 Tax=Rhodanobacter denitrificans TaxID=666685 RepID=UPI0030B87148